MAAPKSRRRFLLGWSLWRRAHQAVAARCRKASLAAKRAARATPGREGPPEAVTIAPEEAHLTDEQWALVCPLLPPQRGGIGREHPTTTAPSWAASYGWRGRALLLAGDARGVRQVGERLQAPRAVGQARPMAAYPPSVRGRRSAGTGDEGA